MIDEDHQKAALGKTAETETQKRTDGDDERGQLMRRSPQTSRCLCARIAPRRVIHAIHTPTRKTSAKSVRYGDTDGQHANSEW